MTEYGIISSSNRYSSQLSPRASPFASPENDCTHVVSFNSPTAAIRNISNGNSGRNSYNDNNKQQQRQQPCIMCSALRHLSPAAAKLCLNCHIIQRVLSSARATRALMLLLLLLSLCVVTYHVADRVVLYIGSGSAFYHDYDYYSNANASRRRFGEFYDSNGQLTAEALQRRKDINTCPIRIDTKVAVTTTAGVAAAATVSSPYLNLQVPAPPDYAPSSDASITVIHVIKSNIDLDVFGWFWDTVLRNSSTTITAANRIPISMFAPETAEAASFACTIDAFTATATTQQQQSHQQQQRLPEYCARVFTEQRVRFELVSNPISPQLLSTVTRLLIVGFLFENKNSHSSSNNNSSNSKSNDDGVLTMLGSSRYSNSIHPQLRIGILTMSGEQCNNHLNDHGDWPAALHPTLGNRVQLLAYPFGDCQLQAITHTPQQQQQGQQQQQLLRQILFPIGPSQSHGFPSFIDDDDDDSVSSAVSTSSSRRRGSSSAHIIGSTVSSSERAAAEQQQQQQQPRPAYVDRKLLLNMQVTYSLGKPQRMQAWLVAEEHCSNSDNMQALTYSSSSSNSQQRHPDGASQTLGCYIYNNDLPYKAAQELDKAFGTSLRLLPLLADPAKHTYLPLLRDSRFTLCPAGKNAESFRIWEAIMAHSIPIIEDNSSAGSSSRKRGNNSSSSSSSNSGDFEITSVVHPAYEMDFDCSAADVHQLLKQTNAPVLYVQHWSELPALLSSISDEQGMEMQRQLRVWYQSMTRRLQQSMITAFVEMM